MNGPLYTDDDVAALLAAHFPDLGDWLPSRRRALQGLIAWSRVLTSHGHPGPRQIANFSGALAPASAGGVTCLGYVDDEQLADRCVTVYPSAAAGIAAWREIVLQMTEPDLRAALASGATNVLAHALLLAGFAGPARTPPKTAHVARLQQELGLAIAAYAASHGEPNEWLVRLPTPENPGPLPPVVPPEAPTDPALWATSRSPDEIAAGIAVSILALIAFHAAFVAPRSTK